MGEWMGRVKLEDQMGNFCVSDGDLKNIVEYHKVRELQKTMENTKNGQKPKYFWISI